MNELQSAPASTLSMAAFVSITDFAQLQRTLQSLW